MLGHSSNLFNEKISKIVEGVSPKSILELGCGEGKFASLIQANIKDFNLVSIQKLFGQDDEKSLKKLGYSHIINEDIYEYFKNGFDENYDLIVALDVIEHFLYSDIISIINFGLYRAEYILLVWPSAHPQSSVTSTFDRHRSSFELKDLVDKFNVVHYCQTGFAQVNSLHRYHIALIRGHMNIKTLQVL